MVRVTAGVVALIAGTMLIAWIAGLDVATRDDTLEPMSPLACVGFLAGAVGLFALRARPAAGAVMLLAGLSGLADDAVDGGRAINSTLFGIDARISVLTSVALTLMGSALLLKGTGLPSIRSFRQRKLEIQGEIKWWTNASARPSG